MLHIFYSPSSYYAPKPPQEITLYFLLILVRYTYTQIKYIKQENTNIKPIPFPYFSSTPPFAVYTTTFGVLDFKMRVRYQRKEVGRHVTDDLLDKKTPFTCRNKSIKILCSVVSRRVIFVSILSAYTI